MQRFASFDGSNLYGSLRTMNLEIGNYGLLYGHIYREAVKVWHEVTLQTAPAVAQFGACTGTPWAPWTSGIFRARSRARPCAAPLCAMRRSAPCG